MVEHVEYIAKTRDYYRSEGYSQDYAWAQNDDCAFAPMKKPLADSRIGLVTTASLATLGEDGKMLEDPRLMGSRAMEVFPLASDWPADRLRCMSEDHDRFQTDMADLGAYFPKDELRALADEGVIGSFADDVWRILPNYSKRKVSTIDAPEVYRQACDQGVDAIALVPV